MGAKPICDVGPFKATGVECFSDVFTGVGNVHVMFDNENRLLSAPLRYSIKVTSMSAPGLSTTVAEPTPMSPAPPMSPASTPVSIQSCSSVQKACIDRCASGVSRNHCSSLNGQITAQECVCSVPQAPPAAPQAPAGAQPSVKICTCGASTCTACKVYQVGPQCQPFFGLCDGRPGGYVKVSGTNAEYSGLFYTANDCSGSPVQQFSSACGQCNSALLVSPQCNSASVPVVALTSVLVAIALKW